MYSALKKESDVSYTLALPTKASISRDHTFGIIGVLLGPHFINNPSSDRQPLFVYIRAFVNHIGLRRSTAQVNVRWAKLYDSMITRHRDPGGLEPAVCFGLIV